MSRRRAERTSILGWLTQVMAWFVIAAVVLVLAVAVLVPRIAGATPYTVLTGSMRPDLPPGTLVVVKPIPADEISVGTVVTYQLSSGKATVVTHRVKAISSTIAGSKTFTTQGDANNVADAEPVLPVQIKGEVWYSVPYLGYANDVLTGSERQIVVVVVATLLLGYASFMFVGSARDRRSKNHRHEKEEAAS